MDSKTFNFSTSFLFFWIKGSFVVDNRTIKTTSRNTIFFGLIPMGSNNKTFQLSNIDSSEISTSYNLKGMLIGILITVTLFWTVIGLIVGVCMFLSSINTAIVITTGGSSVGFFVPFYNKKVIREANDYINEMLVDVAEQHDNRKNMREQTARQEEEAKAREERQAAQAQAQNDALLEALKNNNKE